tara:strand:- start:840 stop:1151 length:312 start_codon:yes stop_codon:yes gene_type:complete
MIYYPTTLSSYVNETYITFLNKNKKCPFPIEMMIIIAQYSRPYYSSRFEKGESVYHYARPHISLYIWDKPYWNGNTFMYNYEYGITGSEGSAIESNLRKKNDE